MPIVDGLTSTKIIRSFERTNPNILSNRAAAYGRVPILAVSASLLEKERQTYIDGGFDGWILKPVDFNRLSVLLSGITEGGIREECLYQPGQWERGGWFCKRQPDLFASKTTPSPTTAVSTYTAPDSYPAQPKEDATDQERERLQMLENDAVHADSFPKDPGQSGDVNQSTEPTSSG